MEEVVAVNDECGGEIYYLHDVLSDGQEDPSTKAARKLDWDAFCSDLPAREKAVVEFLVQGASGSAIARKLRTTYTKIRAIKQHLARAILVHGPGDIEGNPAQTSMEERHPCHSGTDGL